MALVSTHPLSTPGFGTNQIAFSADGRVVAYADTGMNVRVERDGEAVLRRGIATDDSKANGVARIRGLALSPQGETVYAAAADRVLAFDSETGAEKWAYAAPRSFGFLVISPVCLAAVGETVVAGFDNGSLACWEGGTLRGLWHENDAPRWLGILPNFELAGCDGFSLITWDVVTHRRTQRILLSDRAYAMAVSPHSLMAATRSLHQIELWDLETGATMAQIPVGLGLPLLAIHPSQPLLAFSEGDVATLADFEGRPIASFECGTHIFSLAFAPDGQTLVAGGGGSVLRLPL